MSDPLLLLRQHFQAEKEVVEDGNDLVFGDVRIAKDTETSYLSKQGRGPAYTIHAVWVFSKNIDTARKDYIQQCRTAGIAFVTHGDRAPLVNLLRTKPEDEATAPSLLPTKRKADTPAAESAAAPPAKKPARETRARKSSENAAAEAKSTAAASTGDDVVMAEASKRATMDFGDTEETEAILKRERPVHTRDSVLQVQSKQFTEVLDMIRDLKKAEESEARKGKDGARAAGQKDAFWKDRLKSNDMQDLQIDDSGTLFGNGASSSTPEAPRRGNTTPIIIVPSATSAHLTLFNAKEFFEEGTLPSSRAAGVRKPSKVTATRKKADGSKAVYEIRDNGRLAAKDWARVVAVFTNGAAWEFKGWKWPTPVEVFTHVRGFYLSFEGEKVPANAKNWNVHILVAKANKPHTMVQAQSEMWKVLDKYTAKKKAHLRV